MATALVQVRYYYQFTKKFLLPAANLIISAKDNSLKREINCAYLVAILKDRQCSHKRNIEKRSRNLCCGEKNSRSYILRVCTCGLNYPTCNVHAPY